jgi:mannitol-1-/sugar-/sorbitol-6-/2-deoxyglucose-6-phosphatase
VRVGLASSSSRRIIDAAVARLGAAGRFDAIHSAESLRYGKPHPEVYLDIAAMLGAPPAACLAIEDSLNGLIAAKAARMGCVAVPEAEHAADPRFVLADAVLGSLHEFGPALWSRLQTQSTSGAPRR